MGHKSAPTILVEWLEEILPNEPNDSVLKDAQILDSKFQAIEEDKGIVVSNSEWDFAPQQGGTAALFDALMILGFFVRIPSADTTERREQRDYVYQMAQLIATKMLDDESLGGRICDLLLLRAVDGMKSEDSESYAIINLPIILNPTGSQDYTLGEAR